MYEIEGTICLFEFCLSDENTYYFLLFIFRVPYLSFSSPFPHWGPDQWNMLPIHRWGDSTGRVQQDTPICQKILSRRFILDRFLDTLKHRGHFILDAVKGSSESIGIVV